MSEYRVTKRKSSNPHWVMVICCQGQPFDYYYNNVFGACLGLIHNYFTKRKYGTMNFSIKQHFGGKL